MMKIDLQNFGQIIKYLNNVTLTINKQVYRTIFFLICIKNERSKIYIMFIEKTILNKITKLEIRKI